ncbi:unnamed protein product [Umbelopsis sp. WA50703]
MAAEDSEKLARRLQEEEDVFSDILLHDMNESMLTRQLHEERTSQHRTDSKRADIETSDRNDNDDANTDSSTVNNTIESDEALARLLQAEEELQARDSKQTKTSGVKDPPPLPVTSQLDSDEELARRLQAEENETSLVSQQAEEVDDDIELFSPTPDIHALFRAFDHQYFFGMLKMVELKWSKRMTLCAGVCSYQSRAGFCSIRLSEPLLKFRTREDLIDTLLHEMIHALLFVTQNNTDHDGHGPQFLMHAARINKAAGTSISVYHNFRDEVNYHRTHVWKCNGSCQNRPPYFGIVRRSMNRPPQPADYWWSRHQQQCGGTYTKISEPEKKPTSKKGKERERNQPSLNKFFKRDISTSEDDYNSNNSSSNSNEPVTSDKVLAAAKRRNLGGSK